MLLPLAGCGVFGGRREQPPAPSTSSTPPPSSAPSSGKGGYYLDDGPGANPPADIDSIPDAVPRVEPLHKGAMRPYAVMGRNYVPMTALAPYRARGVASWYGRRYHGKQTSTGELYDMYGMSAAHPTLPLPSFVRVTSAANGRSVVVRVNDRGPFIDSRLIDLSYTAAHKLGIIAGGSALVEVELVLLGAPAAASSPASAVPPVTVAPPVTAAPPAAARAAVPEPAAPAQIPLATEAGGTYLQLAAFGSRDNADAYVARVRGPVEGFAPQVQVAARDNLFRVLAGPYASQPEARQAAEKIAQALGVKPFVVTK
jgi:rare lipoprotein A